MNIYNVNDENFLNSDLYQEFIKNNPVQGYLKIRAYAASGAIPIKGLRVVVSKEIEDNNVIFFEGITDDSGVIEKITLPVPRLNTSDLITPNSITYDIRTNYKSNNRLYKVDMYENVYVVQTISIVPDMTNGMGGL